MSELIRRRVEVMGTVVSFHVRAGDVPAAKVFLALAEARRRLERADAIFSTWKAGSPVSRLRRGEVSVGDLPPVVAEVLERCEHARTATGGWFDPWSAPGGVDPTGLVKGWAADDALDVLVDAGVAGAMVSAGGDVALWGSPGPARPWRIGVQNPFERSTLAVVTEPLPLPEGKGTKAPGRAAVATSGSYERGEHVWDPFTGQPVNAVASATVTGPRLDLADAMATALLAGGRPALEALDRSGGFEVLVIALDGGSEATAGFPLAAPEAGGP